MAHLKTEKLNDHGFLGQWKVLLQVVGQGPYFVEKSYFEAGAAGSNTTPLKVLIRHMCSQEEQCACEGDDQRQRT